jgi:hypothetical protein
MNSAFSACICVVGLGKETCHPPRSDEGDLESEKVTMAIMYLSSYAAGLGFESRPDP